MHAWDAHNCAMHRHSPDTNHPPPSPQISHLIHTCLSKLYTHGDIISIYSLVSELHKALNPKALYPEVREPLRILSAPL